MVRGRATRRRPRRDRELILRPTDRARVTLREEPHSSAAPDGAVTTHQTADVALPREELERIWTPEYLERLARTYWRFLERMSFGLLRVLYTDTAREVVLVRRPLVLLRFHAPEYEAAADHGVVTWRIDRGLLVIPRGRGKGFLRITVSLPESSAAPGPGEAALTVRSEVANFYPLIAGSGWFSAIGRVLYRITQMRIHVIVTNAFLRSLARLDLVPSVVGALRQPPGPGDGPPDQDGAQGAPGLTAERKGDAVGSGDGAVASSRGSDPG